MNVAISGSDLKLIKLAFVLCVQQVTGALMIIFPQIVKNPTVEISLHW